jgi:hypothetical protein
MAEASGSVSGEEDALWSEAKALEELMQMRRAAWRAEPDNQVLQKLYADSRDRQAELDKECAGSLAALPGEPCTATSALDGMHAHARGTACGRLCSTKGCRMT